MFLRRSFLVLILAVAIPSFSQGEDLDDVEADSLRQTQELLRNSGQRQKVINGSVDAQKADSKVKSVVGSDANVDRTYDLSADIFADIMKEAGGDPAKLKIILQQAMQDPQAFAEKFSPEQRAKLRKIAEEAQKHQAPAKP